MFVDLHVCFKAYSDDRVGERQILGIQGGVSPGTVPRLLQRLVVRAPDVDGGGDRGCCRLDTVSLCRRYICDRSEAQHSANPIQVIGKMSRLILGNRVIIMLSDNIERP